jgi:hypothetical protein
MSWSFGVTIAVLVAAGGVILFATTPAGKGPEEWAAPQARQCSRVPPTGARQPVGFERSRRLWVGDMEEGTLSDWASPGGGSGSAPGGGEFDSGGGRARASRREAHSGTWAARLVLPDGRGGTRLFRWGELQLHRDAVVSVWLRVPRRYRMTGDVATGRYWNVFQIKSRSTSGANDPLWFLDLASRSGRRLRLQLVWWHRTLEGPRPGRSGFRRFKQRVTDVPVGRWFRLTARLLQSSQFDGMLCVWQGARLIFAKSHIRTSYENCTHNSWCAANEWSVNNYSDGLSPAPAVLYVDDAGVAGW